MALVRSPARYPERTPSPDDPRFLDLFVDSAAEADLLLAGVPYDGAVIGRKGCKDGPTAIREAFRYLGAWDASLGRSLKGFRIHDLGDAPVQDGDTLHTHRLAESHLAPALQARQPIVV